MIIDGEKYACEACVRGHRVSNCQHSDRPLQHINKKGRPVSQCQHCRAMRKSRSAHVKCDCGEKTSKCSHLQPSVEGHKGTCCCHHGGRCTCATKKDVGQLDTVPESDSEQEKAAAKSKSSGRRQRANTVHSDSLLTFDENGHHKPAHKGTKISQKCGPYQLSRVNSLQSSGSLPSPPVDRTASQGKAASTSRHRDSAGGRGGGARGQRRVKSETTSPMMGSNSSSSQPLPGQLPPLDLSSIDYPPYVANSGFDLFGSSGFSDADGPIFSAGLSAASVDWSRYDLAEEGDAFASASYSTAAGNQCFNSLFEFGAAADPAPQLAATTSTSGEVSEVDDNFIAGDIDFDGYSTAASSYMRPAQMLSGTGDISSIDYDSFMKSSASKFLPTPPSVDDNIPVVGGSLSLVEDDPAFWVQNYSDGIVTLADSPDGMPSSSGFWDGQ